MDMENPHYDATESRMNETNDDSKNHSNNNDDDDDELLSMFMKQTLQLSDVMVHPLVLLSVADHYHRVARGTRKRVIGILLGQSLPGGTIDITNSFAVPFEEDSKNPVRIVIDCLVCVCVAYVGWCAECRNSIYSDR